MSENRIDTLPGHPFWDFSLQLYSRPDVASACLALQDQYAADVNLLLFCCWQGHIAAPVLYRSDLQRLMTLGAAWHDTVIRPLRLLRRQLKSEVANIPGQHAGWLRRKVQQLEIDAEHIHQLALAQAYPATAGNAQPGAETAAASLINYLSVIGTETGRDVQRHLQTLLAATFPELENAVICAILDNQT
jgi:uncharacterized protein (TIGR02444 family)